MTRGLTINENTSTIIIKDKGGGGGAGDSNLFIITLATFTNKPDKTWDEIVEAYNAGKVLALEDMNHTYVLTNSMLNNDSWLTDEEKNIVFTRLNGATTQNNKRFYSLYEISIYKDEHVTMNTIDIPLE